MTKCPDCGSELKFIKKYEDWYCKKCEKYPGVSDQDKAPVHKDTSRGHNRQRTPDGLVYETVHTPASSALIFHLKYGQSVVAEAGAMMFMHRSISMHTHGRASTYFQGLHSPFIGRDWLHINSYSASYGHGQLALAGSTIGDIKAVNVSRGGLILYSGSYLASSPRVYLATTYQPLEGLIFQNKLYMLHASGSGTVWVSSFGGIIEKRLQRGEQLTVDTGHLIAFSDYMPCTPERIDGWLTGRLSDEGMVTHLVGPGRVLMQTRELEAFAGKLDRYIYCSSNDDD
jgi:uncharacterized protein (TIGR00266 family)